MEHNFGVKLTALVVILVALFANTLQPAKGQFFNTIAKMQRHALAVSAFRHRYHVGTDSPQATGIDNVFPSDCGRDPDTGTGNLCFPDGLLCQQRKFLALCI